MLIDLHGERAPNYALASVDLLLERGDFQRAAQWRQVSAAAITLLQNRPAPPEALH
ncbi:MAG: hypothetical protein WDO24_25975 [Pseudomonadota bacterium]